jgi:hypothetical protein
MNQFVNPSSRYYDPLLVLNEYLDESNAFKLVYNEDKNTYSLPYLYGEYKNDIEPITLSNKIIGSIKKFLTDNLYSREEIKLLLSHLMPKLNKYGYKTIEYLEKNVKRMDNFLERDIKPPNNKIDIVAYIEERKKTIDAFKLANELINNEFTAFFNSITIDRVSDTVEEIDFLKNEYQNFSLTGLDLDEEVIKVLNFRIEETEKCLNLNAPLAAIILSGSILEGILLGVAMKNIEIFNKSKLSPKDKEGNVKHFKDWTLNNFIDVAHELKFIREDVKKFSHVLRDYRNYIHPNQQIKTKFQPDINTANICWQVVKSTIIQIKDNKTKK